MDTDENKLVEQIVVELREKKVDEKKINKLLAFWNSDKTRKFVRHYMTISGATHFDMPDWMAKYY